MSNWEEVSFSVPISIPTMISKSEQQYLFWLGSKVWQGKGLVVEFGPWLGGSTYCLAAGMHESAFPEKQQLIVFDNFVWQEFMSARSSLDLSPGDCFEFAFRENMREYESIVNSHKQILPDGEETTSSIPTFSGVPGESPIEILFIDGAKSWSGMRHLMLHTVEKIIPHETILVCQDMKYFGAFWVPLFVGLFKNRIDFVHNVVDSCTVSFKLTQPITVSEVEALPTRLLPAESEKYKNMINSIASRLRDLGDTRGEAQVRLGSVMLFAHLDEIEKCEKQFRKCQSMWPTSAKPTQLDRARKHLHSLGIEVKQPLLMNLKRKIWRTFKTLKGNLSHHRS